jgi:hypothetical protein
MLTMFDGSVIVVPVKLLNSPSYGYEYGCPFVLKGGTVPGLTNDQEHDARVFCQCALTATVFDGVSL